MSQIPIRIQGYVFTIPVRYHEGHILTKAEAHALSMLRAENVRNNVSDIVGHKTKDLPPGALLGLGIQLDLQERIAEYEEAYSFREPRPSGVPKGPIEAEAWRLAQSQSDDPEEQAQLAASPQLLAQARKNLDAHRKAANAAMAKLIGGSP